MRYEINDIIKRNLSKFNDSIDIYKQTHESINNDNCNYYCNKILSELINYTFLDKGIVVTMVNSNPVVLKEEFLMLIKSTIDHCLLLEKDLPLYSLIEFTVFYVKSFDSEKYKNTPNIDKIENCFWSIFEKKDIYVIYKKHIEDYYNLLLINDAYKLDMYTIDVFDDMNKLSNYLDKKVYFEIIEKFLQHGNFILHIYESIDYNTFSITKIKDLFMAIIRNIPEIVDLDYLILVEKVNDRELIEESIKKVLVNKIVDETNDIKKYIKSGVIMFTHKVEELLQKISVVSSFCQIFKDKIDECTLRILYLKRKILSDNDYVIKDMKSTSVNIDINIGEMEKLSQMIEKNPYLIYTQIRIDFIKTLASAIKLRSHYPMSFLTTNIGINSENGLYSIETNYDDDYKDFFESLGSELNNQLYEEKVLLNNFKDDYYKTLIQYLDLQRGGAEQLLLNFMDFDSYYENILKVTGSILDYDFINDKIYQITDIFIAKMIIFLEEELTTLYNYLNRTNEIKINIEELLCTLFKLSKHDSIKNDIYYIYYALYSQIGYNIRDNIFHGNVIFKDLKIYVFYIATCLYCLQKIQSWIYNDDLYKSGGIKNE